MDTAEHDLLQRAVDLAVEATDSRDGYIHYLNDDGTSIELCTWSHSTMAHCTAVYDRHYPLDVAGIWADSARRREPQIHNDYASLTTRRGLPPGHAPITRHLGVPAIADGQVRLLLGVGNAPQPYVDDDVLVTQRIADCTWAAIARLRAYDALATKVSLLSRGRQLLRQATWEWDPDNDDVLWDCAMPCVLSGFDHRDQTWRPLQAALDEVSTDLLLAFLAHDDDPPGTELRATNERGETTTLLLQAYWAQRPQGQGRVLRGTLLDVSLLTELDRAHDQATHDALTGLPNRAYLVDELTSRLAHLTRRRSDHFAVHFIDFDGFKAVNDIHGHVKGDAVLIECAHRLQRLTREGEIVGRYGGDEFVLLQNGPVSEAEARGLALRLCSGMAAYPARVDSDDIPVAVSIGSAVCRRPGVQLMDVLKTADHALYEAKGAPDHVVVVETG